MRYLLDTNTCIRFLNGTSEGICRRLATQSARGIVLCSVVKAELVYGALKSARPEENLQRLRAFFHRFVSFPFDDESAEHYGDIRALLERSGTPIGPYDLCIAAIAKANRLTLVTHNTREFARVDGLRLEDWQREDPQLG